jgi:hypothetical protein
MPLLCLLVSTKKNTLLPVYITQKIITTRTIAFVTINNRSKTGNQEDYT